MSKTETQVPGYVYILAPQNIAHLVRTSASWTTRTPRPAPHWRSIRLSQFSDSGAWRATTRLSRQGRSESSKACARQECRRDEWDPKNCSNRGRRHHRRQAARGSKRRSLAVVAGPAAQRSEEPSVVTCQDHIGNCTGDRV